MYLHLSWILSSTLTGKLCQRVQQNILESTGYNLLTSYSQELNKNFLAFSTIFFSKGSDLQLPWNMLCESVRGARPLSALLPLNHFSPPWHWPSLHQKRSLSTSLKTTEPVVTVSCLNLSSSKSLIALRPWGVTRMRVLSYFLWDHFPQWATQCHLCALHSVTHFLLLYCRHVWKSSITSQEWETQCPRESIQWINN